jgi:hypothetical protein
LIKQVELEIEEKRESLRSDSLVGRISLGRNSAKKDDLMNKFDHT